jgi:predicted nucleic acid-binding protein
MIALDTSVAVPAFLPWHEAHQVCHHSARDASVPAHVLVETYSVLTRLPAPHQLEVSAAQELLDRRFGGRVLVPSSRLSRAFVGRLAKAGVSGGATYDGIVALTTAEHGAQLITRDLRAAATYESLGVSFEVVGG